LAARHGIEVLYERQVYRIFCDDDGRAIGVQARGLNGLERHYGRAVIAASDGFQANPEMRTAYLGGPWGSVKTRGSRYNTGEVIRELLAIGARSFGDWAGRHATPIDADAPAYGDLQLTDKTNRLSYPYGTMVNLDGERFVDEGADFNSYTYAAYGAAILNQRRGISDLRQPGLSLARKAP
jgi:tricarballylate dehydrogenase